MATDRKISDLNPYPGDPQDGDLFITAREDSANFKISFLNLSRDTTARVSTFYFTGDQTVDGVKTFNDFIKGNVSGNLSGTSRFVVDGVYITGNQTIGGKKTFSQSINADIDGNAETVTNGVYLIGDQDINGRKRFLQPITGDLSGIARFVKHGVYTTGDQEIDGRKIFLKPITGTLSGTARFVQDGVYTTGDQEIDGRKNFLKPITGTLSGTARFVQDGVYTTGDQSIDGRKNFLKPITGSLSGTARFVQDGVYLTGTQIIGGNKKFTNPISGDLSGFARFVQDGVYLTGNQTIQGTKTFSNVIVGEIQSGVYTSGNQNIEGTKNFVDRLQVSGSDVITDINARDFLSDDALLLNNIDQIASGNKVFKGAITPSGGILATGNKALHFTDGRDPDNFSLSPDKSLTLAFQNGVYISGGADLRVEGKVFAEEIETVENIVGDEGPMVLTDGRDPNGFIGADKSLTLAFQNGVNVSGGADLRVEGKIFAEEIETVENIVGDEGPMVLTDGRDPNNFIGADKSLSLAFQNGVNVTGGGDLRVQGTVFAEEIETIENIVGDEGPMVFTDGRDPNNFVGPDKSLSLAFESGVHITGGANLRVESTGIFQDLFVTGTTEVNELVVAGNISAKTLNVGEVISYNYIHSSFRQSNNDANFYIPLYVGEGASETASVTNVDKGISIITPRKGKVSKIFFKQHGGSNAGNLKFHLQTSDPYAVVSTPTNVESTAFQNTVQNEPFIYEFTNSQHFTSGEALFIKIEKSSSTKTNSNFLITAEIIYTID